MISHQPEIQSLQNKIETSEIILPHISKSAKKIKEIAEDPKNHITKKDIDGAVEKSESMMLPEPAGVIVVNHNPTPIIIHKEAPPVTKIIHHIYHE